MTFIISWLIKNRRVSEQALSFQYIELNEDMICLFKQLSAPLIQKKVFWEKPIKKYYILFSFLVPYQSTPLYHGGSEAMKWQLINSTTCSL